MDKVFVRRDLRFIVLILRFIVLLCTQAVLQDFQRENGEIAGVEGVRKGREGVSVASGRGARE